ncbi:vWA domain-containing protein [Streptomyces sp. NPDC053542]|uniref:vWA domain-containing protein n=1 Tax=Streptomyces sp. NPDC053542 TaxID=3365710 RepID=UPI0037CF017D
MAYQQRIDRRRPGCFLFLVDQSWSMRESIGDTDVPKAQALSETVNDALYAILIECTMDVREEPRHYFDIGVVGYGGARQAVPLLGRGQGDGLIPSSDLPRHARVVTREKLAADETGTYRMVNRRSMVWLDPLWDGSTPMCTALQRARQILKGWVSQHRDSFPPIVLHITDGMATDGDPRPVAARLRKLSTSDGNVLLFNLHLSAEGGEPVYFPADALTDAEANTQVLFEMSSELPVSLITQSGYTDRIVSGARGFVYNADIPELIDFVQIGTAGPGIC